MARTRYNQNAFVGGEFDPTLYGRTDIDNYYAGAAKLENVVVLPQGGVRRREGLGYVDDIGAGDVRLIPFVFNASQQYLIVVTAGAVNIYRNDSIVETLNTAPITNITAAMLPELNWTQSNDVLLLVHPDLEPIEIARITDTNWTAQNIPLKNIPPFAYGGLTLSNPAVACTPDSLSGNVMLSTPSSFWTASHEGQFVNINDGRVYITEVVSGTEAKGVVRIELTATTQAASGDWELEEGYEDVISASRGWPRSVSFHQGRLAFGGLKSRPQTLLFSRVGRFFDFAIGDGRDSDAIDVTIDDDRANIIRNIFPGRGLQIFTTGGEFLASGGSAGSGITPENILLRRGTFHGSSAVRPESVDGATLFVESNGRVIRSFLFSDVEQAFATDDITLMSAHLLQDIKHMALRRSTANDGANFLYVVNGNGTVAVLNTLRSQNLQAWSHFTTKGQFLDVAVLGEVTYFICQREVNGTTVYYLEKLDAGLLADAAVSQTNATPQQTWLGFGHLEGESISLVGDGFVLADETVASGSVTADEAVETLQGGLAFNVIVKTLPLVAGFNQGMMGERRRLVSANFLLEQTGSIWVEAGKTLVKPSFRNFGGGLLDTPPANMSGWLKVPLGGVSRAPQLTITQPQPAPFHLLSITIELGV